MSVSIYFTKDHEYVRVEGKRGVVGISDHAQKQLGDVVYVELPQVGRRLSRSGEAAVVESVKAASDVYAPVSGVVLAVNDALQSKPALINEDCMGAGWLFEVELDDPAALDGLMDEAAYEAYVREPG